MSQQQRREATARRVATLGALSAAGMIAIGAEEAQADVVVIDANADIGFGSGAAPSATFDLPGPAAFTFKTNIFKSLGYVSHSLDFTGTGVQVKTGKYNYGSAFAMPLAAGLKWDAISADANSIAWQAWVSSGSNVAGPGGFTDQYYAFKFTDGGKDYYGWIEGSLSDTSFAGLTYHVTRYAYEDQGVMIATGQTIVPEPAAASLALLGSALVAGAAAVRRLKHSRTDAA